MSVHMLSKNNFKINLDASPSSGNEKLMIDTLTLTLENKMDEN